MFLFIKLWLTFVQAKGLRPIAKMMVILQDYIKKGVNSWMRR